MRRNDSADHLRILLTALVIFHHVAIAYGGSGGWYWRAEEDSSNLYLVAFNAINQSFFMGLFFLLAGYYTAPSYARKGTAAFLAERAKRLGLPWLGFFCLLSPLTVALAQADTAGEVWPLMRERIVTFDFEPGPLWFAQALLIFSVGYVVWQALVARGVVRSATDAAGFPGFKALFAIALGLGVLSFLLRLVLPVGDSVLWLQLGYFPGYVFLYGAGCAAARGQRLQTITATQMWPWLVLTLVCLASLPFALSGAFGSGSFNGGMNLNALYYAFWDPLTGFGLILALLWGMNRWGAQANVATRFLSRRAYAVYVVHPPVVVATSITFAGLALSAVTKFFLVGLTASLLCIVVASLLLRLPGAKNVL
jgi:fucose 4-O-acetylase-like acetyltransferase